MNDMERAHFTRPAAEAKIGRQIRTRVPFSGAPKGTTGRVLRFDPVGSGYDVAIQWDLPGRDRPRVDWFSQNEYEQFLEEI